MMRLLSEGAARLSDVPEGSIVRLQHSLLDVQSRSHLRALGLTDAATLRVCKHGDPCVVQVRATRIGISRSIASQLFVIPFDAGGVAEPAWR
jgi:Fe2+ transport system protein FeoA